MATETATKQGSFVYSEKDHALIISNLGVSKTGWKNQYKFNLVIPMTGVDAQQIMELAARELGRRYQASLRNCSEEFVANLPKDRKITVDKLTKDSDGSKDLYRYARTLFGKETFSEEELKMAEGFYVKMLENKKNAEKAPEAPETKIRKKQTA